MTYILTVTTSGDEALTKMGITRVGITKIGSLAEWNAFVAEHPRDSVFVSSSVDFPEEHTKDERVRQLARAIRS